MKIYRKGMHRTQVSQCAKKKEQNIEPTILGCRSIPQLAESDTLTIGANIISNHPGHNKGKPSPAFKPKRRARIYN